jgi:nucleoside-diphosphate-sugar epimerase
VQRLVITGAGGLIGTLVREALGGSFEIVGTDWQPGAGIDVVADLTDADAAADALRGADLVLDLAADPRADAPWQSVRGNNIPITLNVLEAASAAGVGRLVFASSNHVTGMYENDEPYASIVRGSYDGLYPGSVPPITVRDPIRPDGPYGVGKALGEAAGRFYAEEHGLSVVCLRIGTVNRDDRPLDARQFATLLTHADLMRLIESSLRAPDAVRFAIVYGVSANTWRFWDVDDARGLLGYAPADDAERWR